MLATPTYSQHPNKVGPVTSYKWSYIPYKWSYNPCYPCIRPFIVLSRRGHDGGWRRAYYRNARFSTIPHLPSFAWTFLLINNHFIHICLPMHGHLFSWTTIPFASAAPLPHKKHWKQKNKKKYESSCQMWCQCLRRQGRPRKDAKLKPYGHGWFMLINPRELRILAVTCMDKPQGNAIVRQSLLKVLPKYRNQGFLTGFCLFSWDFAFFAGWFLELE